MPMMSELPRPLIDKETDALVKIHHQIGGDSTRLWRWLELFDKSGVKMLQAMKRGCAFQPPLPGLAETDGSSAKIDPRLLLRRVHAQAFSWLDPRYPARMKEQNQPPPVIYVKGDVTAIRSPAVAIVGSRRATRRGCSLAYSIARDLAAQGVTIVSGLAAGIDAAAHRGALETGRTVAVIGCGIDRVYPPQHAALFGEIVKNGAVVSQFPCGTPPIAYQFPLRNATIARLVEAVLVVEAPIRSGALITADFADDFNARIMACPGDAGRPSCQGSNQLLREGALLVESAADVLGALNKMSLSGKKADIPVAEPLENPAYGDFMRYFAGEAASVDELVERSGRTVSQVRAILTELEITGAVIRLERDRFEPRVRISRTFS